MLALALLAYTAAVAAHGNGFVAAFCGGLAFGAIAIPIMIERINPAIVIYAVLSLTAVRMMPVALALTGAGQDRNTILFVGWFGPRGLASLVFALLALEELGSAADEAVAVIAVTVLLSVIAHGLSAAPLARKYGRTATPSQHPDAEPHHQIALRGLPRQRGAATEPEQLH